VKEGAFYGVGLQVMKKGLFVLAMLITFMAVSCSSAPPQESQSGLPKIVTEARRNAPEDVLVGIGFAKLSTQNLSKTEAETRARAEIARAINSVVGNVIRDYQAGSELDRTAALSFQEEITVALASSTLQGAVIVDEDWIDGTYYVVMHLNKSNVVREINQAAATARLNAQLRDSLLAEERMNAAFRQTTPERPIPENFVRIPGGSFTMGSPASEQVQVGPYYINYTESPQRLITVGPFYMGRYEVTQKEYQEIMRTNPSNFKGDNLPVENVSWIDAVNYCNGRSQREGLTPAYTINRENITWNRNANGYRLPTEAEWEYACRAGTTTAYNTGASISNNTGWYEGNSAGSTQPVGQKPANAWGLYDMHGNVWEWCWDIWDQNSYSSGMPTTDPVGVSSGGSRVLRGGSWNSNALLVRSACRNAAGTNHWENNMGFRIVRNAN
jgi:formylglycine-generating enzyme required for sulfatase activity